MNIATLIHPATSFHIRDELFSIYGMKEENFQDLFTYWSKETDDYMITAIIPSKKFDENEYRLLFSFLKNNELSTCIGIHPVIAVKDEQDIAGLIFFEDMVEFSGTRDFLEQDSDRNQIQNQPLFCNTLRRRLLGIFHHMEDKLTDTGTVIAFAQDRPETTAEALLFQRWDIDGICPTISPEVFLAKRSHIHYAPIGLFTRKSVYLEPYIMPREKTDKQNHSVENALEEILKLIITNANFFTEVSSICDKTEFREILI